MANDMAGSGTDQGDSREMSAGDRVAVGGGLLAALALGSCCVLPLVLVSLGVTGAFIGQLGALAQYKWLTFAVAAGFLGWGFWRAYRPLPCGGDGCARPLDRRLLRGLVWFAAALAVTAITFPYLTPFILSY